MAENPSNNSLMNRLVTTLIISICVGLVLVPSIVAYVPVERSKWMVASSMTLLEQNDTDNATAGEKEDRQNRAKKLLDEAVAINPSISNSNDYMRVFWKLYKGQLQDMIALITKKHPADQIQAVSSLIPQLFEVKDYNGVLSLVDQVFPNIEDRDPETNNSFAYAAALLNTRLQDAEKAINAVLKHSSNFAHLDTKAWVLHRLGRDEEALVDVQKSIQEHYLYAESKFENQLMALSPSVQDFKNFITGYNECDPLANIKPDELLAKLKAIDDSSNESEKTLREKLQNATPPAAPKSLSKENVDSVKESFLILRYHRAEIIRSLGFSQIADWEWTTISKAGYKNASELE
jgi:hypothetical protein